PAPRARRTAERRRPRTLIEEARFRPAPSTAWARMIFDSLGSASSTVTLYTPGAGGEDRYVRRFGADGWGIGP
ncbi:MAG TPA: hypothetical protein VHM69_10620, partial [Rubrobacter sp.]|nr:hypothetical protein [Rubrobacter sp.]